MKAKVNGVELYYEIHGQGDRLVLAHEFSGGYKSWQPQVDALGQHYRVLVYNNRGYPPSTVPTDPAATTRRSTRSRTCASSWSTLAWSARCWPEPSRFLARTIPNATLEVLPDTGHTLQLEEPEAFNAAVLAFVRGLRG